MVGKRTAVMTASSIRLMGIIPDISRVELGWCGDSISTSCYRHPIWQTLGVFRIFLRIRIVPVETPKRRNELVLLLKLTGGRFRICPISDSFSASSNFSHLDKHRAMGQR